MKSLDIENHSNSYMRSVEESYISLENSELFLDLLLHNVKNNINFSKNPSLYEVGFGTGFYFKNLCNDGISSYAGIDLDMTFAPRILNFAKKNKFSNISLMKKSSLDPYDKNLGDFDVALSVSSLYAKNYSELVSFLKHLYSSVKKDGIIILIVMPIDYIQSKIRKETLEDKFNIYTKPSLGVGERYDEFSEISGILGKPYFEKHFENEDCKEYVLYRTSLFKACREAKLWVTEVPFVVSPGKEDLLDLATAFNKKLYILEK